MKRNSACRRLIHLLLTFWAAAFVSRPARAQTDLCPRDSTAVERTRLGPSPSLYCIGLVPVPDLRDLGGTVEMRRTPSPFTVAVTPDGVHEYALVITLHGLPEPSTLGPYRSYVAWVMTPNFSDEARLGVVRNGRVAAGRVAFNKFIIMITAEASPNERVRRGRVLLRAMSPSWLLQPHDGTKLPSRSVSDTTEHAHHGSAAGGWVMPPMHPQVPWMISGLEALVPRGSPWLPSLATEPPVATPRKILTVADGDSIELSAGLVKRTIAGRTVTMYAFNGQYPGPLIRVNERSTVVVNFTNRLDQPTAVHWHGIRLDNRFDGVPHVTQDPVAPGGSFRYVIHFPDAGIYWYHPHHREDIQQDLGLYGNLFVRPARADYFGRADREEVLMLDDILMSGDRLLPYGADAATHALMGRFGNVLLVNGDHDYRLTVRRGDVVRFYLTNASNSRVFNVRLGQARLKLVAGDVGKPEHEEWVRSVVLAPAERYVVEARFDRTGTVALTNHVQAIDHTAGRYFTEIDTLGLITVDPAPAAATERAFDVLRTNREVIADIDRYRSQFARAPDRQLVLTLKVGDLPFGLVQALRVDTAYINPVEWSGTMPMMDWLSTAHDVTWTLRDPATGRENMALGWTFRRGEVVKLRLVNDRHTLHPMHHPVHIHGQRFLVVAVNGDATPNLVWKDTVLVPAGGTVDLLVEMSNPGRWMLHCHIAEHLEAGMHTVFEVR